ncbi:hypothetical protein MWU58_02650 [Flavobacteriaceae bacterium S0825]|uniref:hypothetical protein n=1 Tax=Gaetbulibacter sp. S0825 TaxID=2720084 RepID=UPI0014316FC8|nr:hypothetical protein [Gaetbulibacter sp. S0825]MCK0108186.1 hypothetical protein [Flavobacteriaceae bacterium S0825]NIX63822.1 hypothetical protein [Gaetbulibacter sp. S0825]
MIVTTILQEVNIEEKIKNAPNDDYSIGILIGSLIPFVFLVTVAYVIYYYNKKRANKDEE